MKLLVCSDGTLRSDDVVRFAGLTASFCNANVTILGVSGKERDVGTIMDGLKRGEEILKPFDLDVELISKTGDPAREVVQRTRETVYDLVVIGSVPKESNPFRDATSKAYKIIRSIHPPVLTVIKDRPSLKRILFCSGGKGGLTQGLSLVAQIAKGSNASVTLFHVLTQVPGLYSSLTIRDYAHDYVLSSPSLLGRTLRKYKETLEKEGIQPDIQLRTGWLENEIAQELQDGNYDLVVAGSSPSSNPIQAFMMGDVSRFIVQTALCPVLVVRASSGFEAALARVKGMFGRVLKKEGMADLRDV